MKRKKLFHQTWYWNRKEREEQEQIEANERTDQRMEPLAYKSLVSY